MKSWPFIEATKLLDRNPNKKTFIFETGYGPSGLPHIGTFGEVVRTTMVMNALQALNTSITTKLIVFSDDMDGLRKIPDNIPNPHSLVQHLNKPLTSIPSPFDNSQSYGGYMNDKLCKFLDLFDFEYEFKSATKCYKSGLFNSQLISVLQNYDKIMQIMLPSLGKERQETYSPFLPICPETGQVLQVPITIKNTQITYKNLNGTTITSDVTDGHCKLQWKPDWGMRWAALGIDYEMHGKDLTPSAKLSSQICSAIGAKSPELFVYELFLDSEGKKISKSKGNGLAIEDWLRYAPKESLSLYMFQNPHRAKKLYFDAIPKSVDEYIAFAKCYDGDKDNPAWHIHRGEKIPEIKNENINFNLLLNLASACNPESKEVLWGFIKKYNPSITPQSHPIIDELADYAVRYYQDFVKTKKQYKVPTEQDKKAILELKQALSKIENCSPEQIQSCVFAIGKARYTKTGEWFKALYSILLGQEQGPKLGSLFALYGINNSIKLIEEKITNSEN